MKKDLQAIHNELKDIHYNVKAEVLVAEIEAKTAVTSDHISVSNQSDFNRSYRNDIINVSIDSHGGDQELLKLDLSRHGIYDLLPEGVFHSVESKHKTASYKELNKRQKEEERQARSLFAPLEDAFFRCRIEAEQKQDKTIRDFSNLKDPFLLNFWKIDPSIPKDLAVKLLRLLPYAHQISGNLELTFLSLKKILGVDINYKKGFESLELRIDQPSENKLGVNFVLQQDSLTIQQPTLHIKVQPQSNSDLAPIVGSQGFTRFLQVFYKFFIPFEYHIKTEIQVKEADEFILGSAYDAYLGMATRV
ncbi:hypothetical protein JJL45_12800 [Tamlana sp. s12]|uniref:hypothetical protein n=1 Tax=Tamlana sp. s12 TaxID=1630406 RepID=UPI0008024A9C|nr:hypothetical protein [Tamlana sp. s12]OBQ56570.1 hypothetical protein VQ01_04295 [Tamlana sp. s12]QQY81793.1 hypothetical protein JJL45_12800 [Tamlana sp. s12]